MIGFYFFIDDGVGVCTSIALRCDVKWGRLPLGVANEESLDQVVVVHCGRVVVRLVVVIWVVRVRKAHAAGLLDEHHVDAGVPRVGVELQSAVLVGAEWSLLRQSTEQACCV